jgi:hypothetical protein
MGPAAVQPRIAVDGRYMFTVTDTVANRSRAR